MTSVQNDAEVAFTVLNPEEAEQMQTFDIDAQKYPTKGISYFLSHPALWKYAIIPICCSFVFVVIALGLLFGLAYVPQANAINKHLPDHTWVGWLVGVLLVLSETSVALLLFAGVVFDYFQEKMVEKTFKIEGVHLDEGPCCRSCLSGTFHYVFNIIMFVVTLPLNGIPVVGTIVFCYVNGWHTGWDLHEHYFEAKGMDFRQQYRYMRLNSKAYIRFGAMCAFLEIIPVVNFIFIFTNAIGAALWAIDIEKGKFKMIPVD
eukprot:TRINITY_DN26015_c0_g1_i1.p1 TRINITY_DN26015_c0_g1~~TRINITY_DN26015_c0_g1_i1.p1  ORF type:complete len:260 (-),score=16.28 TRINITY_DN26015_c0_g1_i1:235-1014(-)